MFGAPAVTVRHPGSGRVCGLVCGEDVRPRPDPRSLVELVRDAE